MPEYKKLMNRSFPLVFFECWYRGEKFGLSEISKNSMFYDPFFVYQKNKGADVFYNFSDNSQNPNLLVKYFEKHHKQLNLIVKEHLENYKYLAAILNRDISHPLKDMKEIFALSLEMFPVLTSMIVIGNNADEKSNMVKLSNQTRIETEDFVFKSIDLLLKKAAELLPQEYKRHANFLTYSEIIGKLPSIQILEKRRGGYIYYQGIVYAEINKNEFAKKHNLKIIQNNLITKEQTNEIYGKAAFKGRVIGEVRIVFEISDMEKINTGDILVTSMTTPDLIAISRNFSAIITDEGGMLCHAAIISREFKKPCIIGTKIATQVLHDGDLVEVDADNGIVKILKKVK